MQMISLINDGVVVFVTTKLYFISFISEGSVRERVGEGEYSLGLGFGSGPSSGHSPGTEG